MEEEIARGLASSVINKPFLEQTRRCPFPRGSPPPLLSSSPLVGRKGRGSASAGRLVLVRIIIPFPRGQANLFIITDRKAKWDPGPDQDQASGDEP